MTKVGLGVAVLGLAFAASCTRTVSTNTIEVLNLTAGTIEIRSASGREEPRELSPSTERFYLVQRDTCMEDRLIAHDEEGNVLAESDRPCGGTRWVLEEP